MEWKFTAEIYKEQTERFARIANHADEQIMGWNGNLPLGFIKNRLSDLQESRTMRLNRYRARMEIYRMDLTSDENMIAYNIVDLGKV